METPRPAKAVTGAKIAMIVIFVVLIWLPTLDVLFHWDQTPHVNENRQPAAFPQLNSGLAGIRNFISGLERYYNDHFGFRKRLIYWGQTWKREWFHETLQSGVIIGQKGWLYHAESFGLTEESRRATTPFTSKELEDWQTLFDSRRDWLNRRGIHYLVVIPSDKPSIYPEYLPGWVPKQNPVTKIDQLMAHMQNHSTVEVLDVRPALLQAKQTRQVFYLTDSHWNQYGAFITCNELIRTLSRQMPDLSPLSLNLFDLAITNGPGGNLAWVLTGAYSMIEENYFTLQPRPPLPVLSVVRKDVKGAIIHQTRNPQQKGKAIMFGDSFAEGLMPFLAYHFNEVTSYRLYDGRASNERDQSSSERAHIWKSEIIEQEKPDAVIDEILETLLCFENPVTIKRADALK